MDGILSVLQARKVFAETKDSKETARLAKLRKEQNRTGIDARYAFLFAKLADATALEPSVVEEFVVGDELFDTIKTFFEPTGPRTLTFFYQPLAGVRADLNPTMQAMPNKLFIATGFTQQLTGLCLTFVRSDGKAISISNVCQEVMFVCMDCSSGGMLNGLEQLLGTVFIPSLANQKNWGTLGDKSNGVSSEFIGSLNRFVNVLSTARKDMGAKVILDAGELTSTLESMRTPSEFSSAANNLEFLEGVESLVLSWIKQIEQVLAQSEQMRKEADDIGPGAELEHWRKRMAKFNRNSSC